MTLERGRAETAGRVKVLEHDPRLPAWLNALLNAWPLCLDVESVRTVFAWAWDEEGRYTPGERSLFYNGFAMVRVTAPFGIWVHIKPVRDLRLQLGLGWKLNGRAAFATAREKKMAVKSYEPKDYGEDGRLYVVVTMDDGSTFGQYIVPGLHTDMDAQVVQAAARVAAQDVPPPVVELGAVRTLLQ